MTDEQVDLVIEGIADFYKDSRYVVDAATEVSTNVKVAGVGQVAS